MLLISIKCPTSIPIVLVKDTAEELLKGSHYSLTKERVLNETLRPNWSIEYLAELQQ